MNFTATKGHSNQNAAGVEVRAAQAQIAPSRHTPPSAQEGRKRSLGLREHACAVEKAIRDRAAGERRGSRMASNVYLVRQRFSRLSQVRPGEEPACPRLDGATGSASSTATRPRPISLPAPPH